MDHLKKILSLGEFITIRNTLGVVVSTSGGYDPIHSGHISCFDGAKKYGDNLVVIVNGDDFLTKKKGKPFMPLEQRCIIVASLQMVDYVIPFEIKNDSTVIKALDCIKPNFFAKGGDRTDKQCIPEWDLCESIGIKIVTEVDNKKYFTSSSAYLKKWNIKP